MSPTAVIQMLRKHGMDKVLQSTGQRLQENRSTEFKEYGFFGVTSHTKSYPVTFFTLRHTLVCYTHG